MVVITDSGFKNPGNGATEYLSLTFQIIEGQSKGRLIWQNLSLNDPDPKWLGAAKRRLRAIYNAVCKPSGVNDSSELHNIPHLVSLEIEPAKNGYPAKNRIKKWMPYSQTQSPTATRPQVAAPATRPQSPPPVARPQAAPPTNKTASPPAGKTPPGASRSTSRKTRRKSAKKPSKTTFFSNGRSPYSCRSDLGRAG